jgi:hypothetical protein
MFLNSDYAFLRFKLLSDRRVSEHVGTKLKISKAAVFSPLEKIGHFWGTLALKNAFFC